MNILNWLGRLIIGCLGIAAAWGAWYVVYQNSLAATVDEEQKKPKKELAVEAVQSRIDSIDEKITFVGTLLPQAQTEVRAKVNGYIKELPFDVGDRVEEGETICRLDDTDYTKSLEQAKAALKVAEAQLAVKVEETRLAKRNADLEERLASNNATTSQQAETAIANYQIALAAEELDRARVNEAREVVEGIQKGLKDLVMTSPLTGFVSERLADIGDLAKPDVALMRIVDLETVQTTVNVIEKDYHRVEVGQKAIVTVDADPSEKFQGVVTRIAPVLDPASRTAAVHIDVKNPDLKLKPGMYGRVTLDPESQRKGVVIPLAAVVNSGNRSLVYVVDRKTSKVDQRRVRLGQSNGLFVEILNGVSDSEWVVTLGNRLVQANQVVSVTEVPWSTELTVSASSDADSNNSLSGE